MFEAFVFYFCGALMVVSGIMMVVNRNAVVSACWLVFAFVCGAGIFALLSAPFIAVLQVLVYAGAVMVLFLFVVMMLQGPVLKGEKKASSKWLWPLVGLPPMAILIVVLGWVRKDGVSAWGDAVPASFGSAEHVSGLLLNRYLLSFELISIVLLVAIIGAVALGLTERRRPWK